MIRYIFSFARRELFANLYSVRFIFTMDLICILFLASSFMMLSDYRQRRENYEAKRRVHQDAIVAILNEPDPRQQYNQLFRWDGLSYDRTPIPMSVFVRGLDMHIPVTFHKSQWEEKQSNDDMYRNPILKLYMSPDFAYVVNIILSLLALLFVFDNVCGEKEDGTLKLVLSYPVPKIAVLLGKWLGGFATLLAPFLVSVLFWMIVVTNSGDVSFGTDNIIRFFAIVIVSIFYIGLFFSLGMFISSLTHTSNTALLVCFFVWVFWTVVIPNAAPVAAKVLAPVPSREEIEALKTAVDRTVDRRVEDAKRSILSYSDELEKKENELRAEGEYEKNVIESFYEKKVDRQSRTAGFITRLSPSGPYVLSVTSVAGTGIDAYDAAFGAFDKFKADFQSYARTRSFHGRETPAGWLTYADLPRLQFYYMRLDDVLNEAMFDILLLLMYNVIFFMAAFLAFIVYDPK